MVNKKLIIIFAVSIVAIIFAVLFMPSCGEKKLFVAHDNNYPPFEYLDTNGISRGLAVEVIKEVASRIGYDIVFVPTEWEGVLENLENNPNYITPAMIINDRRKAVYALSDSWGDIESMIYVASGSNIKSLDDLSRKKVGVSLGDVEEDFLRTKEEIFSISFDNTDLALDALQRGDVDAVLANRLVADYFISKKYKDKIMMAGNAVIKASYAVAMINPGKKKLLEKINKALSEIKTDGTYGRIYKEEFERIKNEVLPNVNTTEEKNKEEETPTAQETTETTETKTTTVTENINTTIQNPVTENEGTTTPNE